MQPLVRIMVILTVLIGVSISRGSEAIGPFVVLDEIQDAIFLVGEIGVNTPLDFRRAIGLRPEARLVVLSSPGGIVASALIVANEVYDRGLSTFVPSAGGCYSACSFVFFAGRERLIEGELGVHQMSSDHPDPSGVQATAADILESLDKFGTPDKVVSRMFRTPSESMYVFSSAEIDDLGINRLGPVVLSSPDIAAIESVAQAASTPKADASSEKPGAGERASTGVDLGPRLAMYSGLDFYGNDLSRMRAEDAVQCATACLADNQCRAFTYNANPAFTKGPNCFLKGDIGRVEAYSLAFSGLFLRPNDPEAPAFNFGAIDPTVDLTKGMDLSGHDLSGSALASAKSLDGCRIACIDAQACRAFSYVTNLKQCWLKSEAGESVPNAKVTSGIKREMSIGPADVFSLEP